MRGPSTRPALMASRSPTSMNQVPPGMEMLVTPERSTVWALRAARRELNAGLMVPRPLGYFMDDTVGKPKERWQWPSMRPGIIHLPSASMTSYLPVSSRFTPGGRAPTLENRLPSITTASLCDADSPVPSISVPLRITSVFPLPLMASSSLCTSGAGPSALLGSFRRIILPLRKATIRTPFRHSTGRAVVPFW